MKQKHIATLILSLLLIIGIVLTGGCVAQSPTQLIKDVTPQEALALIDGNQDNPDFTIIDVRTTEEYADGHIENAINVDFRSENFKREINKLDKTKTYLIYCRSGNRSRGALDVMVKLNFRKVYHLSVGIIGWQEEGFPITK